VSEQQVTRRQAVEADVAPGRSCPTSYRYSPRVFDRAPEIEADTIYVVGGMYGNLEALDAVEALLAAEPGAMAVFNGDFHWFDVDARDFDAVNQRVLRHAALRGNVETEISGEDRGAGCGCAYPMDVSDAEVARSNEILERLRETARSQPGWRARLESLPMHLTAAVAGVPVGIVHGDASSLAGWGFAHDQLDRPSHRRWIEAMFREARVRVFASTHTCLPALRAFDVDGIECAVANNGAAGMPNFEGTRHGLVTRLSARPLATSAVVRGMRVAGLHVEVIRLDYDHEAWLARFLAQWPAGSPAHASYHSRIANGPRFAPGRLVA
jgi:hypothetical protein